MDEENFYATVWEALIKEDDRTMRRFIEHIAEYQWVYKIEGGFFPSVEYVMSIVKDNIAKEDKSENDIHEVNQTGSLHSRSHEMGSGFETNLRLSQKNLTFPRSNSVIEEDVPLTSEQRREQVRNSWIQKNLNKEKSDNKK